MRTIYIFCTPVSILNIKIGVSLFIIIRIPFPRKNIVTLRLVAYVTGLVVLSFVGFSRVIIIHWGWSFTWAQRIPSRICRASCVTPHLPSFDEGHLASSYPSRS